MTPAEARVRDLLEPARMAWIRIEGALNKDEPLEPLRGSVRVMAEFVAASVAVDIEASVGTGPAHDEGTRLLVRWSPESLLDAGELGVPAGLREDGHPKVGDFVGLDAGADPADGWYLVLESDLTDAERVNAAKIGVFVTSLSHPEAVEIFEPPSAWAISQGEADVPLLPVEEVDG